ncbi:MAG: C39 family peptidase [Patescibacteria group bacterium]|jgi:hypothetical protein
MANDGREFDEEYAGDDSETLNAAPEERDPRIGEMIRDEVTERGKRFAADQLKKRAAQETGKQVAKETGKQVAKEATKQVVKQGAKLGAEAAVPGVGWVALALDIGWMILSNPKARRLLILSVLLFLGIVAGLGFIFFIMATRDSTPPDAVSATNEADMELLRLAACLDEFKPTDTILPQPCFEQIERDIPKTLEKVAKLKRVYEQDEQAKKTLEALVGMEAAVQAMQAAGTDIAALKEQRATFLKYGAVLREEAVKLGVQLDVPAMRQTPGACGNYSATMIGQYFLNKYAAGKQADPGICAYRLYAKLQYHLDEAFPDKSVQYTDYAGAPDDTYFSHLFSSLAKGAPALVSTKLSSSAGGHYIVITGYNPATGLFSANDPADGAKGVTKLNGVDLTRENLATYAEHVTDGYVLMYYGGDRSFR